ncbi:hypothetical protein TIFTF001_033852 [Ficus carica]|uniref:RING-type E3 ubiquitin transferase n=1 Tax=Ficus carica TaxID=3494 RepID=A0AA88DYV7_FICCA|nr:hypothetical protein TIFTF001_033852 [Ficus carica]
MDGSNWEEEEWILNNLVDSAAMERNIYITASKNTSRDDQTLTRTRLHYVLCVIHRASSDTNPDKEARIVCSAKQYRHQFSRIASTDEAKALVAHMFSDQRIMFDFNSARSDQILHWKEFPNDDSSTVVEQAPPLQGLDDIVARISDVATRFVTEVMASGLKSVELFITIDKCTVLPHQEFDRILTSRDVELRMTWDHDNPELYRQIRDYFFDQHFNARSVMERSRWCSNLFDYDDHYPMLEHDQAGDLNQFERELTAAAAAAEQSFVESAAEFGSVPAAESAVEALENFRYQRSCEDEDILNLMMCVICMEEVMIGSHVTRMPCSHVYHSDCVLEWLHENHTCPLCRFKLPT